MSEKPLDGRARRQKEKALERFAESAARAERAHADSLRFGVSTSAEQAFRERDERIRDLFRMGVKWSEIRMSASGGFRDLRDASEEDLRRRFGQQGEVIIKWRAKAAKQERFEELVAEFAELHELLPSEIDWHLYAVGKALRNSSYVTWNEARQRLQWVTVPVDPLPERRLWRRPEPPPDDGRKGLDWDVLSAQHAAERLEVLRVHLEHGPDDDDYFHQRKAHVGLSRDDSLELWRLVDPGNRNWTPETKASYWRLLDSLERRLVAALAVSADRSVIDERLKDFGDAVSQGPTGFARLDSLRRFENLELTRRERAAPTAAEAAGARMRQALPPK